MPHTDHDVVIIGGGIVGLATAMALSQRVPQARVVLLEKEPQVAVHQSRRNSMIMHSGVYYPPGSFKARFCLAGWDRLAAFCDAHHIPWRRCTKLVVAATDTEVPALHRLCEQGLANGLTGLELIGPRRIPEFEPHVRGVKALVITRVGTVNYETVAHRLAEVAAAHGARILTGARVEKIARSNGAWVCETSQGTVRSRCLINCAGLHADRIARMAGAPVPVRLVPFRIMRFLLPPQRQDLVRSIVYQIPEPGFPMFGVHVTRRFDNEIELGPGIALALAREGYTLTTVSPPELFDMLRYRGFWRLLADKWRVGMVEHHRAFSKRALVRALQRILPDLRLSDVIRDPVGDGILAPAFTPNGQMHDDFCFVERARAIHLVNAPSPAATAALALGDYLAARAMESLDGRREAIAV